MKAPPYKPSNQKVIYVPRFYDKSGLYEGNSGSSGKNGEPAEEENRAQELPVEDIVQMEIEENAVDFNAGITEQRFMGLNSELMPTDGQVVNANENFSRGINSHDKKSSLELTND